MILQLEQIALNYSKTAEGEKAKDMLKYLKSEISVEKTDVTGQKVIENNLIKPTSETKTSQLQDPAIEGEALKGIRSGNQQIGPPILKNRSKSPVN
ncbi:hypothetical protein [Halpernia sp. GG3]